MSDWLDKLAGEAIADKVPQGFYSVRQIMKIKGYSRRHTFEILRRELDIGRIRMVKVRIKSGQREYPTPHYGPSK